MNHGEPPKMSTREEPGKRENESRYFYAKQQYLFIPDGKVVMYVMYIHTYMPSFSSSFHQYVVHPTRNGGTWLVEIHLGIAGLLPMRGTIPSTTSTIYTTKHTKHFP